jgi:hypothetical protein
MGVTVVVRACAWLTTSVSNSYSIFTLGPAHAMPPHSNTASTYTNSFRFIARSPFPPRYCGNQTSDGVWRHQWRKSLLSKVYPVGHFPLAGTGRGAAVTSGSGRGWASASCMPRCPRWHTRTGRASPPWGRRTGR